MKKFLAAILILPLHALALDPDTVGKVFNLDLANGPTVNCFDPEVTPQCEEINRSYCRNLANSGGKLSDSSGTVNLGKSERSGLAQIERAGLDDLVRAHSRLPDDLKRALTNPIRELSSVLQRENDSRNWYRELARTRNAIAEKIRDVARARAENKLKGSHPTKADREAERAEQERVLNGLVTQARMESSPNWNRLGEIFTHVKRDMIDVVNTLPLTPEEKAERLARIDRTNLSFPFAIKVGGVLGEIRENDCRHNMVNAFYVPFTGTLTICAGILNGFQSENALYFTLAHELAHSFNLHQIQISHSQPRGKELQEKLIASNSNMSCDEYAQEKEKVNAVPENFPCGRDTYNQFMTCLNGLINPPEDALGKRNMAMAASALLNLDVCQIADRNQGQAYMNPQVFADRNFAKLMSGSMQEYDGPALSEGRSMLTPVYRLAQELRCSPAGTACQAALATTAEAVISEVSLPPGCMAASREGQENESDWYAHKALILRLRNVTDIRERRQMVASAMGLFCGFSYQRPLSEKDQKRVEAELVRLQDVLGNDNHADDKDRIRNVMTEEMAGLLQCNRPAVINNQNYQACRL